ncbi:MAG: PTS sugar transporter subunit IIA [Verrucomicrobia bacterium]|nr:PTS sugar transporter subunit IIA [Verrucomicrobiota bacterium]MCH8510620.1 cation:proton antiporter [Kiritimatiellia bacterium]
MFPITDNVLIFTVIMSVILFSLLVGAKLKIPDLVLLLIAGAFLGEHGFNVLERSSAITLFGEGSWVTDRYGRRMAMKATASKPVTKITEQRMVLTVSNPVTAARLTDLAFLMRDNSVPGAIFPLTIVREQTDTEEAVSRGEKLLAQCMAHASSADVSMEPHVRVDLNVSDGIIRAIRELRGSTVFAGWGGDHNRGSRIFGTVNQNLTQNCPSRLILCRIMRPPNTTRTLRFPFPPLAERREDLGTLIRETKLLSKQIGAPLHVYLSGQTAGELEARIEKTSPGCDTKYIVKDTWTEARKEMFHDAHEDDLIVLPQIRRNSVLWTPTLDRLPELIARHFPYSNLMIVYPALSSSPIGDSAPIVLPATKQFPAVHGVDLPFELDGPERIQELLDKGLAEDHEMADDAYPLLLDSAKLNPIELAPGVVLIHGHCGQKENSILLIGHGASDLPFLSLPHTPKVIVALLSPKGDAPEIHLRALAAVARRFRDQDVTQAIKEAESAAAICTILSHETNG